MHRQSLEPRANWQAKVEEIGFDWHSPADDAGAAQTYWDESACWVLTSAEVDLLEEATITLHGMCLKAVEHVVTEGLYAEIGFPPAVADVVSTSWQRSTTTERAVYGRFDLAFAGLTTGTETPKLLEYNADTPTSLFEAAVVQWHWLQDTNPNGDQFNSIHEALVAEWARLKNECAGAPRAHFTSLAPHPEDEGTLRYMQDAAIEAGFATKMIAAADIGWSTPEGADASDGMFVDVQNEPIELLYKLLPWDWALSDPFGDHLAQAVMNNSVRIIEPAWKLVMSSKGILPILWKMFPDHPFLVPAYFEPSKFNAGTKVFAKPKLGREGANISLATLGAGGAIAGAPHLEVPGPYGREGYVFQAAAPLATAPGQGGATHHAVIGSWVIGNESRGIGIREDTSVITQNTSRFVPHRFE